MRGSLGLRTRLVMVVLAAIVPVAAVSVWSVLQHETDRPGQAIALHALALAIGFAAAWWLAGRSIMKPAKQILGAVRRVEHGRLDTRVTLLPAQAAQSEFARIAAAFNLIAESLQLRQGDVEAELARSRSAYQVLDTVLNSMQEGLVAVDREGRFLMFNRAAARLFRLDTDNQVPLADWPRHYGLFVPGTREHFPPDEQSMARALRGEAGEHLVLVHNDQVSERLLRCCYLPMHDQSGISGGLAVFTDETQLERAESDLVLLRNAVARLNDIVLITKADPLDAPGPRIVFVNEAFERLTGYTAREAIGNTPRMLQGPGTDRAALDRIRAALEQGLPVREELLNYTRDGRPLWLELDIVPLADESGRYTHLIGVLRDITARKRHEVELRELNANLETRIAERTAELEAFSYSVSHDLRSPLAAVDGFSKALAAKLDATTDDKARHYLARIQAGVKKMEQLIDALLGLSRVARDPLQHVPVDLSALARETVEGLQAQFPGRAVAASVQDGMVADGDPRLLRILMENLLGNAWKFTAHNDAARVEVGRLEGEPVFFVRDNGVGFDMAYADKLFSAFQRLHTEAEFPGTGIGLATVRRIVARHEGRVWPESQVGQGTTIWFTLGA